MKNPRRIPKSFKIQAVVLGREVGLLTSSSFDLGSISWPDNSDVMEAVQAWMFHLEYVEFDIEQGVQLISTVQPNIRPLAALTLRILFGNGHSSLKVGEKRWFYFHKE